MKHKLTVLRIDCGWVCCIIPAVILNYIAEVLQRKAGKASDYFDMIAGTRTGGIPVCCRLLPESKPARDAVGFYAAYGNAIFRKHKLLDEKHIHKGLEVVLSETSFDITRRYAEAKSEPPDLQDRQSRSFTSNTMRAGFLA
jgi:patatin-like phospholipase/acyl hydrolase